MPTLQKSSRWDFVSPSLFEFGRARAQVDVVAVGRSAGRVNWYENGGGSNPEFQEHVIASIDEPTSAAVADVDGDNDLDVYPRPSGDVFARPGLLGGVAAKTVFASSSRRPQVRHEHGRRRNHLLRKHGII